MLAGLMSVFLGVYRFLAEVFAMLFVFLQLSRPQALFTIAPRDAWE